MNLRCRLVTALLACLLALSGCGAPERVDTITLAAAGDEGELRALREVIAAYEQSHRGTRVRLDAAATPAELLGELTAGFRAGTPPDVFVLSYRRLGGFTASGQIDPVEPGRTTGLYAQPLEAFTVGGRLLCRPSNASSMVVYLNTRLFADAGVPLPSRSWSWSDLRTVATALRAKGIAPIAFEPSLVRLAPFVWSNGGELVDDPVAPTRVDLTGAAARQGLRYLLDLHQLRGPGLGRTAGNPVEAFAAGQVAMLLESRRVVPSLRAVAALRFDVAPVPRAVRQVSVLHSDGYCVSARSRHPELAHELAQFAVTGAGAEVLARSGRTVPMARSLGRSEAFLAPGQDPPSGQVFLDQLASVRALPHVPGWSQAESVADEVLAQLFAGRTTVSSAVRDIGRRTAAALATP